MNLKDSDMDNIINLDKYRNKRNATNTVDQVWQHIMASYEHASLDCVQAAMAAADAACRDGSDLAEAISIAELVMEQYRAA